MSLRASKAHAAFAARDSDFSRAVHQSIELAEIAAGKSDFLHGSPPSSDFTADPLLAAIVGSTVSILMSSCLSDLPAYANVFWVIGTVLSTCLLSVVVWIDTRFKQDFGEFERQRERWEVDNFPEGEIQEMVHIYTECGVSEADAMMVAKTLSKYPEFWIDHMLLHEIGIVPNHASRPDSSRLRVITASIISLIASFSLPTLAIFTTERFLVSWIIALIQGVGLLYHKRKQSQWFSGTSLLSMILVLILTSGALRSLAGLIIFIL